MGSACKESDPASQCCNDFCLEPRCWQPSHMQHKLQTMQTTLAACRPSLTLLMSILPGVSHQRRWPPVLRSSASTACQQGASRWCTCAVQQGCTCRVRRMQGAVTSGCQNPQLRQHDKAGSPGSSGSNSRSRQAGAPASLICTALSTADVSHKTAPSQLLTHLHQQLLVRPAPHYASHHPTRCLSGSRHVAGSASRRAVCDFVQLPAGHKPAAAVDRRRGAVS